MYAEIDRQSHSSLGSVPEALRASSAPIVQLCWLNRTVRTWADPEVLSEIARDSSVTNIDVTRRIQPDVQSENHKAIGHPATTGPTLGATGRGVTVAIIDSEVQLQHAALGSSRVVPKRNYTSEPWGTPDAHGTAIAGIIGADFTGHMGLAPEVTMYNYKVMATNRWANAFGWDGARAIQDAVEDGADVINCSWGVGSVREQMSIEAIAITNAVSVFGVGVVKSAGNAGPDAGTLTAPAEAEGVIVVGATDVGGTEVQDYSSRGPAGNKAGPDIVAPGGSDGNPLICCLHTGGFGNAGYGTSYAAPHATGVVALLVENSSAEPTDLPNDFRKRIMDGAVRLHGWGEKDQGTGLMRA
ncbi:S8 family serine peptidase [Streptomyces violaceoruber]